MNHRGFVVARVLHVLAIVVWIGGIAAATTVVFPAMRRIDSNEQKVWLFEHVERNFRPNGSPALGAVDIEPGGDRCGREWYQRTLLMVRRL